MVEPTIKFLVSVQLLIRNILKLSFETIRKKGPGGANLGRGGGFSLLGLLGIIYIM